MVGRVFAVAMIYGHSIECTKPNEFRMAREQLMGFQTVFRGILKNGIYPKNYFENEKQTKTDYIGINFKSCSPINSINLSSASIIL